MSKEQRSFIKQDGIAITVLLLLIIGLLVISLYLPDERPGAIRKELTKQGYSVENVDFKYVADGEQRGEWIYQSSAPVYYDGYYVDQWSVYRFTVTPGSPFVHYIVKPYPALPEPVSITVTFTAEEFGRIAKSAEGQPIEEYVKQIVATSLEAERE